jgi:GMP synthase (glutamine-hydrolysing)
MADPTLAVVRNEVRDDCEYHCDALAGHFEGARELDYPAGERPDLGAVDGVVLTGSTAGVYEADERPWIRDQEALVCELLDRRIPTLGVCFGHQAVNSALGGTVTHEGIRARLVEAEFADDPLFAGVSPVVAVAHGDVVREPGEGLTVVASTDYYHAFGTRHESAPLWTVQFHPEFTVALRERLRAEFDWTATGHSFDEVTAPRVFENFRSLVADAAAGT